MERFFWQMLTQNRKAGGRQQSKGKEPPQNSPALQGLSHGFITPIPRMLLKGNWGCSQKLPHPSGDLSGHSLPCQDRAVLLPGSPGNDSLSREESCHPPPPPPTPLILICFFLFPLDFLPCVLIFRGTFFFFPPDGTAPFALAKPTSNSRGYK